MGIVQAGVPGAGINFAIPVSRLQKLLSTPVIVVSSASPIPYDKRAEDHELSVKVISMTKPAPAYSVELTLRPDNAGIPRSFTAPVVGGVAKFVVVPVPKPSDKKSVLISATFSDGTVSGRAEDKPLKIGATPALLSGLRDISRVDDKSARVTLLDGKDVRGAVTGLENVAVSFGEMSTTLNLATASRIVVDSGERPVHMLTYKVAVTVKGAVVGEGTGNLPLDGRHRPWHRPIAAALTSAHIRRR